LKKRSFVRFRLKQRLFQRFLSFYGSCRTGDGLKIPRYEFLDMSVK